MVLYIIVEITINNLSSGHGWSAIKGFIACLIEFVHWLRIRKKKRQEDLLTKNVDYTMWNS